MTAFPQAPAKGLPAAPRVPLRAAAKAAAEQATMAITRPGAPKNVSLPKVGVDPLDDLVERVRPVVAEAVDPLQVTASLESDGVTDRVARVEYGFTDVFRLAEEVYQRLGPVPVTTHAPDRRTGWSQPAGRALRDIGHGALYLMPSVIFPAMIALLGRRSLVLGLVLGGGLGWILAGVAAWLGYRLLGMGQPVLAARLLRRFSYAGLPIAAVLGLAIAYATGGGYGLVALAAGQMAYQMGSMLLMFYRREGWQVVALLPAVTAGIGYLIRGPVLLPVAIGAGVTSVVLVLALGLAASMPEGGPGADGGKQLPRVRSVLRTDWLMLPGVTVYTALSALYLLHAEAPYLLGRYDIAVAAAPLIAGMGVVEWRARRFGEQSRELLRRVGHPREFTTRIWGLLVGNLLICLVVVAGLALGMLALVARYGQLSPAGVAMAAAHVGLAGAYFFGFLLAEQARYGWLCLSLTLATATHLLVGQIYGAALTPIIDILGYLGSVALLQVLLAVALAPIVGQAWRYR